MPIQQKRKDIKNDTDQSQLIALPLRQLKTVSTHRSYKLHAY